MYECVLNTTLKTTNISIIIWSIESKNIGTSATSASGSSKDISELETNFYRRIRNKTTRSTFNTTVEAVIIISVTTITTSVRTYFI